MQTSVHCQWSNYDFQLTNVVLVKIFDKNASSWRKIWNKEVISCHPFAESQIAKRRCMSRRLKRPACEVDLKSNGIDSDLIKRTKFANGSLVANDTTNMTTFKRRPSFFSCNGGSMTHTVPPTPSQDAHSLDASSQVNCCRIQPQPSLSYSLVD